ncbi:MAG: hypothetical protein ACI8PQ_001375, partial [Planctomycetota bacterium]
MVLVLPDQPGKNLTRPASDLLPQASQAMQRIPQNPTKGPVTGAFRSGPQEIGCPLSGGSCSRVLTMLLVLLLPALTGCASNGENQNTPTGGEEEAYVPLPVRQSEVGSLMLELDKTLKAWQQAVVTNNSVMLRRMESILRNRVNDSFDMVIEGLESPAPALRQTAATALGFSGKEQALSPLASALHDPDDRVVANALVGLGQLASPLSPVSVIAYRLRTSTDQTVRSNAAFALVRIAINDGARDSDSLEACRQGLYDDFPAVRGHCASFLG